MRKVWVLTIGEYSDYHIVAVYDETESKEAERVAELIGADVEEYEVNTLHPEDPGMDYFSVVMGKSGEVIQCYTSVRIWEDGKCRDTEVCLRTKKDNKYERKSYWRLYWDGYAKSKEHAVKIISDIRRQILAGQRPKGVDMGKN